MQITIVVSIPRSAKLASAPPAPNSQFNYPAYTVETVKDTATSVDWINDLVADPWSCNRSNPTGAACRFIPHLLAIDRSLHWANPENFRRYRW